MNVKSIIEKLRKLIDPAEELIEITNIATLNDGDEFLLAKSAIILSIVNIEEDKTLINQSNYINGANNGDTIGRYTHPTRHLVISLLFSSYNKDLSKYLDGIDKLNNIFTFFQQNTSLYYKNDESELIRYGVYMGKADNEKANYAKITFNPVSMNMEQLNQMWSYLGSKYMPSVLLKMSLVNIQTSEIEEDALIKEVKINVWENNKDDIAGLLETVIHNAPE